jgi:hypothetical protein
LRIFGKVWLRTSTRTKDPTMTATTMNLKELLEKTVDTDFLREMIGFTAQRLMELEVETLTSTTVALYGELRFAPPTDSGGCETCRLRRGLDHYWLGKTNSSPSSPV